MISTKVRTIAVFRALQFGDMLCAAPSFRSIRKAFPEAEISLIGLPWAEELVKRFSAYLDNFISFPGFPGLPELKPDIKKIPGFIKQMQAKQWDFALQMHGSGEVSNILISLFGAKKTAGYYLPGNYRPNRTLFFPYPSEMREVTKWIDLLRKVDITTQGDALEFPISEIEKKTYKNLTRKLNLRPQSYVCIHPGSRDEKRRWPVGQFAQVADTLASLGYTIILTGTHDEAAITSAVGAAMKYSSINLTGKTDLGLLASLIKHAALLVSNDTGVSHAADALKTPSVIIFLASNPKIWAPSDILLHRIIKPEQASVSYVVTQATRLLIETAHHRHQNKRL